MKSDNEAIGMMALINACARALQSTGNEDARIVSSLIKVPDIEISTRLPESCRIASLLPDTITKMHSGPLPEISRVLEKAAPHLPWTEGEFDFPEQIAGRLIYAEIAESPDIRCGLYFQAPDSCYPDHSHEARELYFVLSGEAQWRRGKEDYITRKPGTVVLHESY